MRRGDVCHADLEPARGSEANKTRPVVLVSNDAANGRAAALGRGTVTVVPLTSSVSELFPFQVLLPRAATGLPRDSKAQAEQVRSVDVSRLHTQVGHIGPADIQRLDRALRLHLGL
ncbi:MAG: type II toxin-antitoxin system PemK/MazF family toxin [Bifidobacteriaceae bacterium]|jgi:mRNA interferase MazF|nr:type II toxin-antitoxin system PemK/MazF family toxin [Bifidobacteriaceae bacterium]